MTDARSFRCWCASCRKTFPDLEAARSCACGRPVPANRGEWVVNVHELERLRRVPCTCGAQLIFVMAGGDKQVPVALDKVRRVTCPLCAGQPAGAPCATCRGRREFALGLAHFLDCPDADQHRRTRPAGYASPHGKQKATASAHAPRAGAAGGAGRGTGVGGVPGEPPAAHDGGRDQPAPRLTRAALQRVLELVRASSARNQPLTTARLRELLGFSVDQATEALDRLRAARLVRPVHQPGDQATVAGPGWETTPRGDREDAPLSTP